MLSPHMHDTVAPVENISAQQPFIEPRTVPVYDTQSIEALSQQLIPRLMPEILHQLYTTGPSRERNRAFGISLALAIVSIVMLAPMTGVILGTVTSLGGGMVAALIGISVIAFMMVLINVIFNYALFHRRG